DGKIINDSSVICAYLERVFPNHPLYPSDPYAYARALWFEEYVDGGIVPPFGQQVFMPVVLRPMLSQTPPEAAAIEQAGKVVNETLSPLYAYLETQLGSRQYFVGDALSIADLSVGSFFVNARHAGFPPDARRFPKLASFVERMHARPSFA